MPAPGLNVAVANFNTHTDPVFLAVTFTCKTYALESEMPGTLCSAR